MSSELQLDLRLQIGPVLFIDIVGYSKLLINAQSERLHQLNGVFLSTDFLHPRSPPISPF